MMEKTKFTTEVIPLTVDFTAALPTGETVSASSTVTAVTSAGVDATAALLTGVTNTSTTLSVTIKATAAGAWLITYTAITSPGGFKIVEQVQLTVT